MRPSSLFSAGKLESRFPQGTGFRAFEKRVMVVCVIVKF